ncbi:hypothetical protein GCM10014715_75910 [Streptomyces spiralis]|uniref:Uncharacterized protein n=1 Tax=Streptomyces spiralis TaxID=66376 RepID=A0A919AJQ3_9ACTN|nr:hypothetical protein GCM10014715_75910 [Streptomyces spiralis]
MLGFLGAFPGEAVAVAGGERRVCRAEWMAEVMEQRGVSAAEAAVALGYPAGLIRRASVSRARSPTRWTRPPSVAEEATLTFLVGGLVER